MNEKIHARTDSAEAEGITFKEQARFLIQNRQKEKQRSISKRRAIRIYAAFMQTAAFIKLVQFLHRRL
jgi:hypothetical protein